MPELSAKLTELPVDGENNPIHFDFAYSVRKDLADALDQIKIQHGDRLCLLPMAGMSAGGGIFQQKDKLDGTVVGVQLPPPVEPRISRAKVTELYSIDLDQIVIDPDRGEVCAGAAITLDQLNQALQAELGSHYKVPGADLTSYQYASVGATFMTGGMGPQRRYFSDSVSEISLHNGDSLELIEGHELRRYAGTYGWTGIVTALRCRYFKFPENEIAFALPVSNNPPELAALLDHISRFCFFDLVDGCCQSPVVDTGVILGVEHVTRRSMGPMLRSSNQQETLNRAHSLLEKCEAAGVDGLLFISGYSDLPVDEFLFHLVDDADAEVPTIAGISLDHSEVFNQPETMRVLREAIPFAARTQKTSAQFTFKNHSDGNIQLNPAQVGAGMELLWQKNCSYVQSINDYFASTSGIEGEVLVYGHLNPFGVDPHNRVTFSSNDAVLFETSRQFIIEQRAIYYRGLQQVCESTGALFIGGEKSADSERGILKAFDTIAQAPEILRDKYMGQCEQIKRADRMFNWRALPPYR